MASKAFRKKELVRQLKQQRQEQAGFKATGKNAKRAISYVIIAILVLAVAYYIYAEASRPQYVPEAIGPSFGPADASVTFLEFGCFTCPYTKQLNTQVLPQLMQEYEGRVRFVYRAMPIPSHPGSQMAAEAAWCADDQDMFWDYADLLFRGSASFSEAQLKSDATVLGLDMDEFNSCLGSSKYEQAIRTDYDEGKKAGISVTPTVFVNGVRINGIQDIELYRRVLDDKLAGK